MNLSMQRLVISSESEWMFMKRLIGKYNMFKLLLDNQATLHMIKNGALVSNISAGMSAVQEWDIPYVGVFLK